MIQDYGFRLYNPAIGKFLSFDPLAPKYPELTPYQFASNTPIQAIDLDGLEMWEAQWWKDFGDGLLTNAKTSIDVAQDVVVTYVNSSMTDKITGAYILKTETAKKLGNAIVKDPLGVTESIADGLYNATPLGLIENTFREDGGSRQADNVTDFATFKVSTTLSKLNRTTLYNAYKPKSNNLSMGLNPLQILEEKFAPYIQKHSSAKVMLDNAKKSLDNATDFYKKISQAYHASPQQKGAQKRKMD